MTRLNSRNRFSLAALCFLLILFSDSVFALLQGNRILFVDDFNDQDGVNQLGGKVEGNFVAGEEAFGKRGASLALNYEMDESTPFSYFWMGLGKKDIQNKTHEARNLEEMGYLSFWVKLGESSSDKPFQLFVEIHEDTDGDGRFVLNADVSDQVLVARFKAEKAEREWKKMIFPFPQFRRIRRWDRILEIAFAFESGRTGAKGALLLDNILFGSNYLEGGRGREIPMQNRVSSFKIDRRLVHSKVTLRQRVMPITLILTFVDPYLEEIRFEESRDGGQTWRRIQSFYDHANGGAYSAQWDPRSPEKTTQGVLVRAVGMNVLGAETQLAGPYHVIFS